MRLERSDLSLTKDGQVEEWAKHSRHPLTSPATIRLSAPLACDQSSCVFHKP